MTVTLSAQQLAQYDRDGILFPISVLTPAEVALHRRALGKFENETLGRGLKRADGLHLRFPWAYRLATANPILDSVEALLGPNILIDGTLVFCKPPRDHSYVTWHQDSVYSDWHKSPTTSAWIALTVSNADNGCMRVIPGSHKSGLLAHTNINDDRNLLRRGESVAMALDESQAVDVTLQAGEMSLHHCNIIHGSKPNLSDHQRIGFIVRYVTNQHRSAGRPLIRVRGNADCSHLQLATPPVDDPG